MISLNELKKVTDILGTVLSKEEVDEFMKEADKVTKFDCLQIPSIQEYFRTVMAR